MYLLWRYIYLSLSSWKTFWTKYETAGLFLPWHLHIVVCCRKLIKYWTISGVQDQIVVWTPLDEVKDLPFVVNHSTTVVSSANFTILLKVWMGVQSYVKSVKRGGLVTHYACLCSGLGWMMWDPLFSPLEVCGILCSTVLPVGKLVAVQGRWDTNLVVLWDKPLKAVDFDLGKSRSDLVAL